MRHRGQMSRKSRREPVESAVTNLRRRLAAQLKVDEGQLRYDAEHGRLYFCDGSRRTEVDWRHYVFC